MRKYLFCLILLILFEYRLYAEKGDINFNFGTEGNMSSDHGWALGRSVGADFQLFQYIVNGVTLTISDDFKKFTAIEPAVFCRWYLPLKEKFPKLDIKDGGFFIQGDIGFSAVIGVRSQNVAPLFLGGLTAGFRYPLLNGDYYAEPFLKSGYPFLFGVGVRAGVRL